MPTQRTARVGLQIWLDAPEICERIQIGTLYPNMQQTGLAPPFAYTEDWLGNKNCFMLDPRLDLYVGDQHPASERGFGVFLDSAPDRWGSKLIQRREVLKAKAVQRSPKLLSGLELMLGVHDFTRSGALRFCYPGGNFLDDDTTYAVPPVTSLKTLSAIALELDDDNAEDKPEYEHWLSILVAPGSSLGGTRPKAVFAERDHSLWLAKFPGRNDTHDWGLWEYLTHQLARKAGIDVPESELLSFGKGDHTFCVKRFDRNPAARRYPPSLLRY